MNCTYNWNCPPGSFPYTVRKGDTLYSIAKNFETTVERLAQINSISNINLINIGDVLCIPLPLQYFPLCRTTNYYVVNEGDTIYSIANYFGVEESQILYSNLGIDEDNLYEGMILCIPLAKPPLCIALSEKNLILSFPDKEDMVFMASFSLNPLTTTVVQKQLDTSFGGKKRINLQSGFAISNPAGQNSERDVIISEKDMDSVFNLVTVGTEVIVR